MTAVEIEKRFLSDLPLPSGPYGAAMGLLRARVCQLALIINGIIPDGPRKDAAFTALERMLIDVARPAPAVKTHG